MAERRAVHVLGSPSAGTGLRGRSSPISVRRMSGLRAEVRNREKASARSTRRAARSRFLPCSVTTRLVGAPVSCSFWASVSGRSSPPPRSAAPRARQHALGRCLPSHGSGPQLIDLVLEHYGHDRRRGRLALQERLGELRACWYSILPVTAALGLAAGQMCVMIHCG